MWIPSYADSFAVLLLQAAEDGRGPVLFGDSLSRAREAVSPFLVGEPFPSIYLEHPLMDEPFLDVMVLYGEVEKGTRISSPAAGEHAAMFDWYAQAKQEYTDITCGFELDTKERVLPTSALHFQLREHYELVLPFCESIGEPERAKLFLDMAHRMPPGWELSFFGLFRGRPSAPMRVCGYLNVKEQRACAHNSGKLTELFDTVDFSAYNECMIEQLSTLLAAAPGPVDFQFDVYPDGSLSDVFAIDIQFEIKRPQAVLVSFTEGKAGEVMRLFEQWGAADNRWKMAIESAFARAISVELDKEAMRRYAFTLMPQWAKARWIGAELQAAKLYHLASATLLSQNDEMVSAF
ncbi:MAG: hypothetical protein IJ125_09125 [Atopobiaceae bacterium]|nr:hypothetical protein [Atopobiaceae bacterium]